MGADISLWVEIKSNESGKWEVSGESIFPDDNRKTNAPFGDRNYRVFSILAGVRNEYGVTPISHPKGLPMDSEYLNEKLKNPCTMCFGYGPTNIAYTVGEEIEYDVNYYGKGFLTLAELLSFDYDKTFENRCVSKVYKTGNAVMFGACLNEIVPIGEGRITSYMDFLGESFFEELRLLQTLGSPEDVRIVFYFS